MFERLKSMLTRPDVDAATQLPPPEPMKPPKKGGMTVPSFFKTAKPAASAIQRNDRRLANTDLLNYRSGADSYTIIRDYVAASPDLSNAVFSYLRLGIPQSYTAIARNLDGTVNPEATSLVQQVISRMDYIAPQTGVNGASSIRSLSEQMAKELVMYGSMSSELIVSKNGLPDRIAPISVTKIEYWPSKDGKGLSPVQVVGSDKIPLDIPTVVILSLDQDQLEAYSESMIQSAIKPTLFSEQLAQDLHKVILKAIHPRVHAKIDEEVFRKYGLSSEAQMDPTKANEELAAVVAGLEAKISGLAVDDALVYMDSLEITVDNPGSTGLSSEYETLQSIADARMAAGAKTMPAVMGKGGNQNTASAEVMLFVKAVEGTVKCKIDEMFSRQFTTACRLFGLDVYVDFKYEDVSLRPKEEMLAFTQTKLSIVSDLLSMGMITDEEASIRLTGELPPVGAPKLSGTMFRHKGAQTADPAAGTNNYNGASNDGSTLNQKTKSDQPAQGRGGNKKVESEDVELEAVAETHQTIVTPNITVAIDNTKPDNSSTVMRMRRDDEGNLIVERIPA